MALGFHLCHSSSINLPNSGDDEFAGNCPRGLIESIVSPIFTSCISSCSPSLSSAPISAPALPVFSIKNKLFEQFIMTYLAAQAQPPAPIPSPFPIHKPWDRPLKARFPKTYLDNLHMEDYKFCQKCKDHFNTSRATGLNQIPFIDLLLCG